MLADLRLYTVFLALLSGMFGIIYWYKLPNNKAKFFVLSIWLSALTELVGIFYTQITGQVNYMVFNIYMFIILPYYILFLKSILRQPKNKQVANVCFALFVVSVFLNLLFLQDVVEEVCFNNFAIGVVMILMLSCLYLVELFNSNLILSIKDTIFFWFVLGILLFYVPFLPFMLSLRWFLSGIHETTYSLVIFFLNVLMNTSFIFGFIWSKKRYQY